MMDAKATCVLKSTRDYRPTTSKKWEWYQGPGSSKQSGHIIVAEKGLEKRRHREKLNVRKW